MSGKTKLKPEETLDDLLLGGLKIIQPKDGYRFSLDAVLLAHFCKVDKVNQVIDLGTGNGILPILLTYRSPNLKIKGVEIQSQMAERAKRSIAFNHLEEQIEINELDIKELKKLWSGGCADLVVCNPPFYKKGQGQVSTNQEEAIARHELAVSMPEIVSVAKYLLTDKGQLALIHRADRLIEITNLMTTNRINPVRIRPVYSKLDSEAKLVLIEGQKHSRSQVRILPPLVIYRTDGEYSDEIKKWYSDTTVKP